MPSKRMVRMVSATEAKNRFGAIIKQAYADDEHLIIERGGIPVVAIVPIQDYARLIREEELSSEVAASVAVSSQAAGARTHLRTFLSSTHDTQRLNTSTATHKMPHPHAMPDHVCFTLRNGRHARTHATSTADAGEALPRPSQPDRAHGADGRLHLCRHDGTGQLHRRSSCSGASRSARSTGATATPPCARSKPSSPNWKARRMPSLVSSGMAAVTGVLLACCCSGQHFILTDNCYHSTLEFSQTF
jgi:prevent-host-death family protein